ncbi:MAG TPA: molybdopterin-binding protein [Thermodesulfobacteriota bacterium]|nr:molybdopterin-binding protein [Thermodesulfobacteriota bacterium]
MDKGKDLEINLLEKTELWIQGISLQNARLDDLSAMVAEVLELEPREVMVVDVRDDHIVLDVLRPVLKAGQIAGKGKEILRRISDIPGVTITPEAAVHSEGALGWVCLDQEDYESALKKASLMGEEIRERVGKRAMVFSTGFEVQEGLIADTNLPLIEERLQKEGYSVCFGGILPDNQGAIAYRLQKALEEGFGLILTTGGVGAEEKDCTVEALLRVDPNAATPYILKFQPGTGRHVKDGVRIAIGRIGLSRMIALPGPTREVQVGLDRLLEGLKKGWDEKQIADHIAVGLRGKWRRHHR